MINNYADYRSDISGGQPSANNIKHIFVTAPPATGKTTLIVQVLESLLQSGIITPLEVCGIYTEETIQPNTNVRSGFDVVSVSDPSICLPIRAPLARVGNTKPKVGRYEVYVESFENIAIPQLDLALNGRCRLLVIDEIGRMELFSSKFSRLIETILDSNNDVTVLGTLPSSRFGKDMPAVSNVKTRANVLIKQINKNTRDSEKEAVFNEVSKLLKTANRKEETKKS